MSQRMFPESRRFQIFRYGTAIIVMSLYLSYLSYLLTQVAKDAPLVQISYEYVNKLNIPDIEICGSYSNVEITRCTFTWDDWSSTTSDDCSALLSPKARVIDNTYCYLYVGNDTYFYGNTVTNPEGPWIRTIDFYFKINNITEITSRYLSVGTITIQLLDPLFNPFWRGSPIITGTDKRIKQELQLTNGFAGIQNMSTAVYFKKTIFRTILPYDISSILGGNPSYSNTTYLTTTSKDFPMHPVPPNVNFTDTGHFSIAPGSFILEVKSEKRAHTVIGILGLAGGAFGLTVGIYVVLFGQKRSNPWGLMHRMMKFEINDTNLQNSSELPFVSTFDPIQNHRIPIEQRITRLEVRILNLEMILKDYVFDPSALKRMVNRQKLNEVNEICLSGEK